MRILAYLPRYEFRVLERALAKGQRLVAGGSGAATVLAVHRRSCQVLVLDPAMFTDDAFRQLVEALSLNPLPVLMLASLTPETARRIVSAAGRTALEVILRGEEGGSRLLGQKLASLYEPSVPAQLFGRVARRFELFPDRLQEVSVGLFGGGPTLRWVNELAAASGIPRRSVDRWMHRAGICGASALLGAARLARTWRPLVEEQLPLAAVSDLCGYPQPRTFVSHARRIVGIAPNAIAKTLTPSEFVDRLVRSLLVS